MCALCSEIDTLIARYHRLGSQSSDKKTNESAVILIAELEARKADLHSEEPSSS